MATISLSGYFGGDASYDDVTGVVTKTFPAGLTEEQLTLKQLEDFETIAANKRTDLNFPISEKGFADNPSVNNVSRTNSTNTVAELQVERIFQIVGWYKFDPSSVTYNNAVNNND